MPFTVDYRGVAITCEKLQDAAALAKLLAGAGNADSPQEHPRGGNNGSRIGRASFRLLTTLVRARPHAVRQDSLVQQFGYENETQLAGVVSAAKKTLKALGLTSPGIIAREKGPDGENSYTIAPEWVEKVRAAVGN